MAVRAKQTRQREPKSGSSTASGVVKPGRVAKPAKSAKASAGSGTARKTAKAAPAKAAAGKTESLEQQLAAAKARIADLEKQRDDALNRIDWAIDSLQTLLADKK